MARDNSVGGLYMRLGLSLDELESDFIAAENSVRENMSRLNRESNLIQLRAEVEVGDLDAATQAVDILTAKETALNEQLKIQRDKIKLASAAYQDIIQKHGETATVTLKAATALERERLALQRIEKELQSVSQAQEKLKQSSQAAKSNPLLDKYNQLKGNFADSLGGLSSVFEKTPGAANLADGAITKVLATIGKIPAPVGIAITALTLVPAAFQKAENALVNLAKPAISSGDAFYVMSRGLQMSISDTAKLSTICKVTGIEISEVISSMRRLNMQLVKSDGSDKLSKTLNKYGVDTKNATGELKNAYEMSAALAAGLKKAQEQGKGKEFIASTLGRSATGDMVTYLEDLAGNIEQAKKVVKNKLSDPVKAHAIQGELNTLEAQSGQLNSAFSNAFMPIAEVIVPRTTQRLGELTRVIADNAEGIKTFGLIFAEVVGGIENVATTATIKVTNLVGSVGKLLAEKKDVENQLIKKYAKDTDVASVEDLMQKSLGENFERIKENPELYQQTLDRFKPYFSAIEEARKVTVKSWADFKRDCEAGLQEINKVTEEELEKSAARIEKYADELAHIKIELQFGDDTYQKSLAELDLWHKKALLQAEKFEEEKTALAELYGAKREQIDRKQAEEIAKAQEESQKLLQSAGDIEYGLTHSAFEKQLYDIERWKEAQLEKATIVEETAAIEANAVAKVSEAIQNEVDRIKGLTQSLEDEIFEMENSRYEADKRRALQKAQKALDDGVDSDTVQRWLNDKLGLLKKQAREDKSGNYTKSPTDRNYSGDVQIIDFSEKQNKSAIELFTDENKIRERLNVQLADSTQKVISAQDLLAKNTLKNADIEIIEGDRTVQSLNDTTRGIIDANKTLTDITKNFADMDYLMAKLPDYTQGIIDAMSSGHIQKNSGSYSADSGYIADLANFSTILKQAGLSTEEIYSYLDRMNNVAEQSLQDSYSGLKEELAANIADEISNAVTNAVGQASNIDADNGKAQSFSDSVQKVTDANNQLAQSTNSTAKNLNQSSKGFELILGDRLITAQKSLADATNQIAQDTLKNAVNPVIPKIAETPDTSEITNFQSKITEMIAELDKSMIAIRESSVSFESVISATARSSEEVSNALHITATAIEETSQKIASIEFNIPQPVISNQNNDERQDKLVNTALDSTQTLGQMVQLGGMATAQPEIVLIGTVIDILSDIAGKIYNFDGLTPTQETAGMNQLQTPTLDIQPLIVEVQAIKSSIDRFQPQPPNITVSPSINIDLGGAYVFDDSMKKQLTDDITNDVVNAVTEAVEQAKSTVNYGYGN